MLPALLWAGASFPQRAGSPRIPPNTDREGNRFSAQFPFRAPDGGAVTPLGSPASRRARAEGRGAAEGGGSLGGRAPLPQSGGPRREESGALWRSHGTGWGGEGSGTGRRPRVAPRLRPRSGKAANTAAAWGPGPRGRLRSGARPPHRCPGDWARPGLGLHGGGGVPGRLVTSQRCCGRTAGVGSQGTDWGDVGRTGGAHLSRPIGQGKAFGLRPLTAGQQGCFPGGGP